jgi:four helix bundle protein
MAGDDQPDAIKSYRDLRVWQEGLNLAEMAYRLVATFPKDELYGLTSEIRRSASSVPANIAEGYGRGGRATYVQFLRIAQGSLKELETHLLLALRVDLASNASTDPLLKKSDEIGRMLNRLIASLQAKQLPKP